MINKIKITNLSDAESYAYGPYNDFDVWISAVDPVDKRKMNRMKELLSKKGVKHFYQLFSDWSDEDGLQWATLQMDAPEARHIQNIITFIKPFVEDNKVHNLGINCFAGISRSSAIALIVLTMSGKTIKEAIDYMLKIRFQAWPNLRVLSFASDILGVDIHTPVVEWKKHILEATDESGLLLPPEFSQQ